MLDPDSQAILSDDLLRATAAVGADHRVPRTDDIPQSWDEPRCRTTSATGESPMRSMSSMC
jgi:hypothetical protein